MNHLTRMACVAAVTLLSPWQGAVAQQSNADAVRDLRSSAPLTRSAAFQLLKERGALGSPSAAAAMVDLVEREQSLIMSTLRESNATLGIGDKYGEGYGEYINELLMECVQRCNLQSPRTLRILADALPAGSSVGADFATEHGPKILDFILTKARTGEFDGKREAILVLDNIARTSRNLTPSQRARIDTALVEAIKDKSEFVVSEAAVEALGNIAGSPRGLSESRRPYVHAAVIGAASDVRAGVRREAVIALGKIANPADRELLRKIAENDPSQSLRNGRVTYPVRDEARRAAAKLPPR
jgi:hypothetical protein